MGKVRINLVTLTDVQDFCKIMEGIKGEVYLVDGEHKFKVSAKSMIGAMLSAAEWNETWLISDEDLYEKVRKWAI